MPGATGVRKPPTPQLSCELCRERKVRCDKLEPCTTCVSAGVECLPIFRQRLPRGRHAQKVTSSNVTLQHLQQQRSTQQHQHQHQREDRERDREAHLQIATERRIGQPNNPFGTPQSNGDAHDDLETTINVSSSRGTTSASATSPSADNIDNSSSDAASRSPHSRLGMMVNDEFSMSQPNTTFPDLDVTFTEADHMLWTDSMKDLTDSSLQDFTEMGIGIGTTPPVSAHSQNPSRNTNTATRFENVELETINEQSLQPSDMSADMGIFGMLCMGGSNGMPSASSAAAAQPEISTACLFRVYVEQVDPAIKILHRPSLSKLMEKNESYLTYPEGHAYVTALKAAVCYAAACSLTENQCRQTFPASKTSIVTTLRRACERALEQADVLGTRDMTVLQAFVLYIVGRRSELHNTTVWTLVSLAVRLAKGMVLYSNAKRSESFFNRQMRKRLWLTISVMDLQASFAHGSEPLIDVKEVACALDGLKHLRDTDFDPNTTDDVPDREELTDATFAHVTYHAQVTGRLLNYTGNLGDLDLFGKPNTSRASNFNSSSDSSISQADLADQGSREDISAAFDQKAFALLRFCDPEASNQAWFTWHSTHSLVSSIRLAAVRPIQPTMPGHGPTTCGIGSRERNNASRDMELALRVLQKVKLMHTDPRSEGLRWYVTIPWHALAVAIAACHTGVDEALTRQAWPVVEFVWQLQVQVQASRRASPAQGGLLAQFERLMWQTREKVRPLIQSENLRGIHKAHGAESAMLPSPRTFPEAPMTSSSAPGVAISQTTVESALSRPARSHLPENNCAPLVSGSSAHEGFDCLWPMADEMNSSLMPFDDLMMYDTDSNSPGMTALGNFLNAYIMPY